MNYFSNLSILSYSAVTVRATLYFSYTSAYSLTLVHNVLALSVQNGLTTNSSFGVAVNFVNPSS